MEIDISKITGEDVVQVTADVSRQPTRQNSNQPQGERLDLWKNPNIPTVKPEFLKYTQTTDTFTFFFNERTNNVPAKEVEKLKNIFKALESKGYTFRAGFKDDELGTELISSLTKKEKIEWFFTSRNYNKTYADKAISNGNKKGAFSIAKGFNKAWDKIPPFVRALCARDIEILLGKDLDKAVGCVFTYTPCGAETVTRDFDYGINGQLGFDLRVAKELKIPIFNINSPTFNERFVTFIKEGKYISAAAYKISQGGNDHTDGNKVQEDLNTNVVEEKKEEVSVSKDPTDDLFK